MIAGEYGGRRFLRPSGVIPFEMSDLGSSCIMF